MRRQRTAPAQAADGAPTRTARSLVVTGALMLLALFALHNPWFGTQSRDWPWAPFLAADVDLLTAVVRALWAATGLWALLAGLGPASRVRSGLLLAFGAVLLVVCTRGDGGLALVVRPLQHLAPLIAVGAGLLLAQRRAGRRGGRMLAGLGALAFAWFLAAGFGGERNAFALSDLGRWWDDLSAAVQDPGAAFDAPNHLWWTLLPETLVLLGCLVGLLAALGMTGRGFLRVGFWILLIGLLVPYGLGRGAVLDLDAGLDVDRLLEQSILIAVGQGFLLWMLGVYTIFDSARERMRAA